MSKRTIEVFLNSQAVQLPHNTHLAGALAVWREQALIGEQFAAAVNGEFVPRSSYDDCLLGSGDMIDIVAPVGGG